MLTQQSFILGDMLPRWHDAAISLYEIAAGPRSGKI